MTTEINKFAYLTFPCKASQPLVVLPELASYTTSSLTFSRIDEVRGDVTSVKLHTLDDLQLIVQSLPILTCEGCTDYYFSYQNNSRLWLQSVI